MSSYIIKKLYSNFRSVDLNLIFLSRLTANSAQLAIVMVLSISLFNKNPGKVKFSEASKQDSCGVEKRRSFRLTTKICLDIASLCCSYLEAKGGRTQCITVDAIFVLYCPRAKTVSSSTILPSFLSSLAIVVTMDVD